MYQNYGAQNDVLTDFYFRRDYITKKVWVVSLARDTVTGPPLHLYQILLNYLKPFESDSLHKILASGEITYYEDSESCLFLRDTPTGPPLHSYHFIIKICLRVLKLCSAQGWQTDAMLTALSPYPVSRVYTPNLSVGG